MLHSFGRDFKPWKEYGSTIRTELDRQSPWPLDIQDQSLVSARASNQDPEVPFIEYLRALYSKQPPDLIVALGAPASIFVQRHRPQIFPNAPMVFTAVEQRRIEVSALTELDTVVAVAHDFPAIIANILRILPDTKNVMVVIGSSPNEKFWLGEMRRELKPFENRTAFIWTSDLSFQEILKQASELPPHSAIYWHGMLVDGAGVVHEGDSTLKRLHAIANAPMFTFIDVFFNGEVVGGPMHSMLEGARETAAVAIRILKGERPGDIKVSPTSFAAPIFNWRELQRWGIRESRLPPGSEIHFREPTAWERYREQIVLLFGVLLFQAALIGFLIYEHRRRHLAEIQSRNAITELTYMNRRAAAGELSATIAHEINQPLTGISTRASAALRWLRGETPNLEKAGAALEQIVAATHRAADIVTSVRAMFKKDTSERLPVDVNRVILAVLAIVRIDLQKNRVELRTQLDERILLIEGDEVQLQQVVLNLVMNAIDSMRPAQSRVLSVISKLNGHNSVQVSIEDTGIGIDSADRDQIFKPLFTTKDHGMGMGLSICRSIIEGHEGKIWVTAGNTGGTIFHFELPTKASDAPAPARERSSHS
jgi:signal transduction histidine kinase